MTIINLMVCISCLLTNIFMQFCNLVYVILGVGIVQSSWINPNILKFQFKLITKDIYHLLGLDVMPYQLLNLRYSVIDEINYILKIYLIALEILQKIFWHDPLTFCWDISLGSLVARSSDHQTLFISRQVGFHVISMWVSHPFFGMLTHGHFCV